MDGCYVSCSFYIMLVIISAIVKINCTKHGCFYTRGNGIESFCCDNYEFQNGICIECQDGYTTSGNGEPCKPCTGGMYGRKCSYYCNCLTNHICNHIKGCVLGEQTVKTLTDVFDLTSHTNGLLEDHEVTVPVLADPINESDMIVNKETALVLGLCGLVAVFAMVALSVCYRRKRRSLNTRSTPQNDMSIDNDNSEDVYDVIDSDALYDDNIIVIDTDKSTGSTSNQGFEKNDYLTPCSVDVEKYYMNKASEHQPPSSIEGDVDSDYLHPYSSLISSTMETPNIYVSLQNSKVVQLGQANSAATSLSKSKKKTKCSARRWSFNISDLSFDEFNKEVSNICINTFETQLFQTEFKYFSSTDPYERLVNNTREKSDNYCYMQSSLRNENTKKHVNNKLKCNTI